MSLFALRRRPCRSHGGVRDADLTVATMAEPALRAVAALLESFFDSPHRLHRHQRRRGGLPFDVPLLASFLLNLLFIALLDLLRRSPMFAVLRCALMKVLVFRLRPLEEEA